MAAPTKKGFDFFKYEVYLLQDRKIKKVLRKYGPAGAAVYTELLAMAYRDLGYGIATDETIYEDIADALYMKDPEEVKTIVEALVDAGLFDAGLFLNDRFLTSAGIQKRFREMNKYRVSTIPARFLLLDEGDEPDETETGADFDSQRETPVSHGENPVSQRETPVPHGETPVNPKNFEGNPHNPTAEEEIEVEKEYKQTNKQKSEGIPAGIPIAEIPDPPGRTPPPPPPGLTWKDAAAEARRSENWNHARNHAKEIIFFRGISSDLIDAAAVCLIHGWLGTNGLRNIRRKARDALEIYDQTRGRRGTANGWETVRDCVSLVIREKGLDPPAYSRKNPEPVPGRKERPAAALN